MLDLKHGYHQMPLHEESGGSTAMSTRLGPMQWKVVPMGARNSNTAFQGTMKDLLGPVQDCADLFLDDIIIGSATEDMSEVEWIKAHDKDLRRVLNVLRPGQPQKAPFSANKKGARCPRWPENGLQAYKGISISEGGRVRWPCGYSWAAQADTRQAGRVDRLVATQDGQRVGAVLEQVREVGSLVPVALWSRLLAEGQQHSWTAREKVTYTIVFALRKWSGHFGLQPIVVCTDHHSLQTGHNEDFNFPSGPAARRAWWHEKLGEFHLSVVYAAGKDNSAVDCRRHWAYPAGKAWMDISMHGVAEETVEAKRIIEAELLLEEGKDECFVVMGCIAELAQV